MNRAMRVLFAPDYRAGVPYQEYLATALRDCGATVVFPSGYRRILPLTRAVRDAAPEIVHLHWPEAYFSFKNDGFDGFRRRRLPVDVRLARRHGKRLVLTAHNLFPHRFPDGGVVRCQIASVYRSADAVIAHSAECAEAISQVHGVPRERITVIPHGDLSSQTGPLPSRGEARLKLGLPDRPFCLMFGRVDPYKGLDEVAEFWKQSGLDVDLWIVGHADVAGYGGKLLEVCGNHPRIRTRFEHVPDEQLSLWLGACNCVLFNYRQIFTSGAASLARSCGVPILLPGRLRTLDLGEPDARVARFGNIEELQAAVPAAIKLGTDHASAAAFRASCSWNVIAAKTHQLYTSLLG